MKAFNMNNTIAALALLVTTGLFGCKKDGVAPAGSSAPAQLSFGLQAVNVSTLPVSNASPSVKFTSGTANIVKFQFEAKKNGAKMEIENSGLKTINLFAVDPSFFPSKIDTGTYSEIELKLVLARATTGAIPLQLKGSFTRTDGNEVPVELNVNEDLILKTEIKNLVVDANTDIKTTVMIHLNKLWNNISTADLEAAALSSGSIIISSSSNVAIFNKVKSNAATMCGHHIEGERHGHDGSDDQGSDDHGSNGHGSDDRGTDDHVGH